MTAHDYLNFIVDEIHSTVVATVDSDGLPVTCVIDMMYADENGLYFLTAKGKNFYQRLKYKGYLALSGKKRGGYHELYGDLCPWQGQGDRCRNAPSAV